MGSGTSGSTRWPKPPAPGGRRWTVLLRKTDNEQERVLRATADAHERRFSALTERSPVPTLLSEQGMRLAHVNDSFCSLVDRTAEQLLGTGWMDSVHPDDLDAVVDSAAAALEGDQRHREGGGHGEEPAVQGQDRREHHGIPPGSARRRARPFHAAPNSARNSSATLPMCSASMLPPM